MTPDDCKHFVHPEKVSYFLDTPHGREVVEVWTTTKTPRSISYLELGNERIPMSLFLDENVAFCEHAYKQRGLTLGSLR